MQDTVVLKYNSFFFLTEPTPVKDPKPFLKANNQVRINCTKPEGLNGPHNIFTLKEGDNVWNESKCDFNVEGLSFLATYNFSVSCIVLYEFCCRNNAHCDNFVLPEGRRDIIGSICRTCAVWMCQTEALELVYFGTGIFRGHSVSNVYLVQGLVLPEGKHCGAH